MGLTARWISPVNIGWKAADFLANRHKWNYRFTPSDVASLEAATTNILKIVHSDQNDTHLLIDSVKKTDFPLTPSLANLLGEINRNVVFESGFHLVQGFPTLSKSSSVAEKKQIAAMYYGIALHFGQPISQNGKGHVLGHVKNLNPDLKDPNTRIYTTSEAQRFHSDSADIVGLLCLHKAKEGGLSSIASSHAVFNRMVEKRPDLAHVLTQTFRWDRKGEIPPGQKPYYDQPIYNFNRDGVCFAKYDRNFLISAKRWPQGELSAIQIEAIDMMESLCKDDTFRLDMDLQPGEIQFVNNHTILHARTRFVDDSQTPRHLLRLWLSSPEAPDLPPAYVWRYGQNLLHGQVRGGINVAGVRLNAPLDAE